MQQRLSASCRCSSYSALTADSTQVMVSLPIAHKDIALNVEAHAVLVCKS